MKLWSAGMIYCDLRSLRAVLNGQDSHLAFLKAGLLESQGLWPKDLIYIEMSDKTDACFLISSARIMQTTLTVGSLGSSPYIVKYALDPCRKFFVGLGTAGFIPENIVFRDILIKYDLGE